jgi:hypothetical protein
MPVATAKVQGRRKVDYKTLDEIVADAARLSSGPMATLGNWSAGQIFQHLANAFNRSIDGFPTRLPWFIRVVARLFKKRFVSGAMPAGLQVPAGIAKVVMPDPTATAAGLAALREAVARLHRETTRAEHPALGKLTREEWDQVHLNHANLHMSFIIPQ